MFVTEAQERRSKGRREASIAFATLLTLATRPAQGADFSTFADADSGFMMLLLLLMFAILTAFLHLVGRYRWTRREREIAGELERTRAELDRANLFLASEPQIVIVWDRPDAAPRLEGEHTLVADAPSAERVLSFAWLEPALATKAREALVRLLERGETFSLTIAGLKGRHFEIVGRPVAGNAVMRIRDVSGDRLQLVRLAEAHERAVASLDGFHKLLDSINHPAWTRRPDGALDWANSAYARAVEAENAEAAAEKGAELFDLNVRRESTSARAAQGLWRAKAPVNVAGERRTFEAVEVAFGSCSAGLALDTSETERLRGRLFPGEGK